MVVLAVAAEAEACAAAVDEDAAGDAAGVDKENGTDMHHVLKTKGNLFTREDIFGALKTCNGVLRGVHVFAACTERVLFVLMI